MAKHICITCKLEIKETEEYLVCEGGDHLVRCNRRTHINHRCLLHPDSRHSRHPPRRSSTETTPRRTERVYNNLTGVTPERNPPQQWPKAVIVVVSVLAVMLITGLVVALKNKGEVKLKALRNVPSNLEPSGSQKTPNPCIATVPPDRWKGEYFNNKNLQGSPSMVRDDGNGFINFNWSKRSPSEGCGIGADNFSVRWTRTVRFDSSTYRFTVRCDEGFKLYVDDMLKLDGWYGQSFTTHTINIPLTSGNHTIKMEYYEKTESYEKYGVAIAELSWQAIPTPKQLTAQPSQQIDSQRTKPTKIDLQLSGEWEGKVYNEQVKLSITQSGNKLSGSIIYSYAKEYLEGEINTGHLSPQIVLRGTGVERKRSGSFSFDTFFGTVSTDGNSISGNCTDTAGNSGKWFATKPKSSLQVAAQKSISNHDILSKDEVKAFIEKMVNLSNKKGNIDEIMQLYADKVDYQEKGYVTKDFVKQSMIDFQKMWSDVEYKLVSPIKVSSGNENDEKKAKFTLHKISRNDQVTAESDMKLNFTFYKQENSIVIIKENLTEKKIVTKISYQLRKLSKRLQKGTHITIITGRGQPTVFYTKLEQVSSDILKIYMHHRFDEGGFGSLNDLISCEWSSSALSFVGVWDKKKNMQIYLKPEYDSSGYIKSFDGYVEGGRNNSRFELGLYPNLLSF